MIDWHCHMLPGLDDGATDIEQSLKMAASLSAAGFTTVYCTPHFMRGNYEASNSDVRQQTAILQEGLHAAGIPLQLQTGREYCLDEYLLPALDDPLPLGNSTMVLIEIHTHLSSDLIRRSLYNVVRSGFTPVIAHPERCPLLEPKIRPTGNGGIGNIFRRLLGRREECHYDNPADSTGNQLLDYLRDLGCSFQGNLGSFNGFYGRQVQSVAEAFRRLNIYDRFGSDLHSPGHADRILSHMPRS